MPLSCVHIFSHVHELKCAAVNWYQVWARIKCKFQFIWQSVDTRDMVREVLDNLDMDMIFHKNQNSVSSYQTKSVTCLVEIQTSCSIQTRLRWHVTRGAEPNNATRQYRQHLPRITAHFYSFQSTPALKIDFSAGVRLPFRHHHYRVLFSLNSFVKWAPTKQYICCLLWAVELRALPGVRQ